VVEGGDHSLAVSKKSAVSQEAVYARVEDEITRWITGARPGTACVRHRVLGSTRTAPSK
jgi:hypothetical protein